MTDDYQNDWEEVQRIAKICDWDLEGYLIHECLVTEEADIQTKLNEARGGLLTEIFDINDEEQPHEKINSPVITQEVVDWYVKASEQELEEDEQEEE